MTGALEDGIDAYGMDDFSPDFLTELERAEEAFPSSFCAPPPNSAVTTVSDDDEFDSLFLEPCSQEIAAALDEMEHPEFVPSQCRSATQLAPLRFSLPSAKTKPLASTAPCAGTGRREMEYLDLTIPTRVPASGSSACSTVLPSTPARICVKMESPSPTAVSFSSSPPTHSVVSKRKREFSVSDSDSDEEEVEFKKPKLSPPATHLSNFFSSYPKFEYDPSGPASQQFRELRTVYKMKRSDPAANEAYHGYNRALGLTFSQQYGEDVDDLANWQKLCRTVEIFPVPDSLEECERVIEDAHVNLIDLVDVHTTREAVHRFKTEQELSEYTMRTGKIFPRDEAYKGPLLRHLLRRIFHPPREGLMRRGKLWVERHP
ncbi:hypothetical protein DFH09DRAFT_1030899 [Mycena vulgaris]|nr:hypothetical protein DFH09DRAFT_1030899 [Mycena vulgaris]